MRSEKITINLSTVELAQIDYLVEKGLYASRSDFIRLAIRKQTEEHKKGIEQFVDFSLVDKKEENEERLWFLGIAAINQQSVEDWLRNNTKINIRVIGALIVTKEINPEQFRQVLSSVEIHGKIFAEPEIKEIIEEFRVK